MKKIPTPAIWIALLIPLSLAILLWRALSGSPVETALAQSAANFREEIIFIDDTGRIRVLDLTPATTPRTKIQWISPAEDGAWYDLDVGDFNADGDAEIVAIQAASALTSVLRIYEPVLGAGNQADFAPGQLINTIPWARLYTVTITGTVTLVAAGNLDASIPGDEIIYAVITEQDAQAAAVDTHERSSLYLLRSTSPGGRTWQPPVEIIGLEPVVTQIRIGEIDQQRNEEILVVAGRDANEEGELHIYQIDYQIDNATVREIFVNESEDRPWTSADIGQLDAGLTAEVIAGRRARLNESTFWAFRYTSPEEGYFADRYNEFLAPAPRYVFFADVNGNGDEEAFILRGSVEPPPRPTPTPQPRAHLIMRNRGPDALPAFEVILDADAGYQVGAGGDVDEDRRDEVVIARNNNIRIYTDPEANAGAFNNQVFNTNSRTLRIANLDTNGYLKLPLFVTAPTALILTMAAGTQTPAVANIALSSDTESQLLDFALSVEGNPSWLTISPTTGRTPLSFQVSYTAYGLAPVETYTATIVVAATNTPVANTPLAIPVELRVTPGLWPQPTAVAVVLRCDQSGLTPVQVQVGGLLGVFYSANLVPAAAAFTADFSPPAVVDPFSPTIHLPSQVPWATLVGNSSILPTTLTITFDPSQRSADSEQATLQVSANDNQNEPHSIAIPVSMSCASANLYLPVIAR